MDFPRIFPIFSLTFFPQKLIIGQGGKGKAKLFLRRGAEGESEGKIVIMGGKRVGYVLLRISMVAIAVGGKTSGKPRLNMPIS